MSFLSYLMTEDKKSLGEYETKLLELASKAENGNHDFSKLSPLEVLKDISRIKSPLDD